MVVLVIRWLITQDNIFHKKGIVGKKFSYLTRKVLNDAVFGDLGADGEATL